ncbi:Alpha/Beta hydrolase protein [Tricharina praecox]|uniref:Alpha/Beta hydrolase protein n=1 Tax=Tricharina praecox TaxID=43433 RepID=UPI00221ECD0C|nr:Alpha/Beta hydrolase protein [Tricharina praecox]KAI5854945.1 Alpha/Beta hydrolase protein [Tricharina praecox]
MSESETPLTGIPKVNPLAVIKLLLPHLPNLVLKTGSHLLSFSPQAQYWDLKTTLTVAFIKSAIAQPFAPGRAPPTVEKAQADTLKPTKVEDDTWCAEVSYSPGEGFNGEDVIRAAIIALGAAGDEEAILKVSAEGLSGEWISSRSTPRPADEAARSPEETYAALAADTQEKDSAILYLHGGAYYLCDPHTHRPSAVKLSRQAKTRAFVVRYRLSPQSPFPGPLLDALISYLYLLYPPPGAMHAPIAAEKIVFSGDSAGGGLSLALLQLLIHFSRTGTGKVHWYGQDVAVPLPGGVALISAWCDVPRSFGEMSGYTAGSENSCEVYDYLPLPQQTATIVYADSPAWNAEIRKQRGGTQFYAPDRLMTHPLVSPLLAESWVGGRGEMVPVWMSVGDECLRDQNLYLAHRLHTAGIKLRLEIYTAMPHVFQAMLGHLKVADMSWASMGKFVRHATGAQDAGDGYWKRERIHPKTLDVTEVPESELKVGGFEFEQVKEMLAAATRRCNELADGGGGKVKDVPGGAKAAVTMAKI